MVGTGTGSGTAAAANRTQRAQTEPCPRGQSSGAGEELAPSRSDITHRQFATSIRPTTSSISRPMDFLHGCVSLRRTYSTTSLQVDCSETAAGFQQGYPNLVLNMVQGPIADFPRRSLLQSARWFPPFVSARIPPLGKWPDIPLRCVRSLPCEASCSGPTAVDTANVGRTSASFPTGATCPRARSRSALLSKWRSTFRRPNHGSRATEDTHLLRSAQL